MAILLGATRGNLLQWGATVAMMENLKEKIALRMSQSNSEDGDAFLAELAEELRAEMAFEEEFSANYAECLSALQSAVDNAELAATFERFRRLAADYFLRRGSVISLHETCTQFQDLLLKRIFALAENWLVESGIGLPATPHAWFGLGNSGRLEGNFSGDFKCLLVYEDNSPQDAPRFVGMCRRVAVILEEVGFRIGTGINPINSQWRGSLNEWRRRVSDGFNSIDEQIHNLVILADMRQIHGDQGLGAAMLNLVRGMLEYHFEEIRGLARGISRMPVGFDFFGRFRVEKEGEHQGEFNMERYAWLPLVNNVRVMAIRCNIHETSTLERIRKLQERGCVDVDLAERLLHAYHDTVGMMLRLQLGEMGGERYGFHFRPRDLDERESERLKSAMEAVAALEIIVYAAFAKQE